MIRTFADKTPKIARNAFVAPTALVLGDVDIAEDASVWYGSVVRGDVNYIRIGARTNVQDRVVIHVTTDKHPTILGEDVTVGHAAVLHGCRVEGRALVGIGAIVLDGVEVAAETVIAAGALLPPGKCYPGGSLLVGSPARVARELTEAERRWIARSAERYVALARQHVDGVGGG